MTQLGTGKIRIEGDATKFNGSVKDVKDGLKDIEKSGISIGESFSTTMNQTLELVSKVKDAIIGVFTHISEQMSKASLIEKRDIAYTMLKRSNKEYFELAQNAEKYTFGLMKSSDAVFILNKAVTRNFNLTKKSMQEILEISSKIAVSQGMEINDVFDKISESVAKGEMAPLEELGYIDLLEEKVIEYAKSMGKTTDEIDRQAKSEIVLGEIRRQNAQGLIGTMSAKEFDIKMELTKNLAELEKQNQDFSESYNVFWANKLNTIGNFIRDETNIQRLQRAKQNEILKKDLGGQYKTWNDYMTSQQQIVDRGGKMIVVYSNEYTRSLEKIKGAVIDFQKSMESKTAFNTFYIGLQTLKYELKPITDEFVKLKNSIWFLKDEPPKERPIVDKDKIKAQIDLAKSELMGLYNAINQQEFKTYQDKIAWEERKAKYEKSLQGKKLSELKNAITEQNKILFGKERTAKDIADFEATLSEYDAVMSQAVAETNISIMDVKKANDELFKSIHQSVMDETKKTFMSNQNNINALQNSYNLELDRFREYANEKKLTAEQLAAGLEQIDKRYNDNKKRLGGEEFDGIKESRAMLEDMMLSSTKSMYNALFAEEENAMQRLIANSLMSAGANIFAKGVENVWIGFGDLISTFGLKGSEQMGVGFLQIGAGVGLGYTGNAIMPSGGSSNKEESAKIENQIAQKDKKMSDESKIFLFPSEQKWNEAIDRANKKIRR